MSPFPLILSSPSGAGKTSIARRLLETRDDVGYSISVTTRAPRAGEVDGRDYYFWTEQAFLEARDREEFAEWASVHGKFYGTLRSEVDRVLSSGRHVILDIDVQGAGQLVRALPQSVSVFVLPPSAQVLAARLGGRKSEDPESFRLRLLNAVEELLGIGQYDYVVVNDDLERAAAAVGRIIDAEAMRRTRIDGLDSRIGELVAGLRRDMSSGLHPLNQ